MDRKFIRRKKPDCYRVVRYQQHSHLSPWPISELFTLQEKAQQEMTRLMMEEPLPNGWLYRVDIVPCGNEGESI